MKSSKGRVSILGYNISKLEIDFTSGHVSSDGVPRALKIIDIWSYVDSPGNNTFKDIY